MDATTVTTPPVRQDSDRDPSILEEVSLSVELCALKQVVLEQQASIQQLLEGQQRLEASLVYAEVQRNTTPEYSVQRTSSMQGTSSIVAKFKARSARNSFGSIGTLSSSASQLEKRRKALERNHSPPIVANGKEHNQFQQVVEHPAFEHLSAALILIHSITIGAYVEYLAVVDVHQHPLLTVANATLGTIFILEVFVKAAAERRDFFSGTDFLWNIFDCGLVILVVVEIALHIMHVHNLAAITKIGEMIRTGRVLRILKCLRLSSTFQVILSKILFSVKSLFWVCLLVFMLLYVVAVCIAQGVVEYMNGQQHEVGFDPSSLSSNGKVIFENFGSVEKAIYTLFESITGGKIWGHAADSLSDVHDFYSALFIIFIAITTLSVLNIVTGIFVDATIMSGKHQRHEMMDAERTQQEMQAQHLREVFCEIDADSNGRVPLEEFEKLLQDSEVCMFLESLKISTADVKRLFKMLDQDGSGEIMLDEFVNGCMHLQGGARNFDVHRLLAGQRRMQRKIQKVADMVESLQSEQLDADAVELRIEA